MSDCPGKIQKLVAAGLRAGYFAKQLEMLGPAWTPAPTNSKEPFWHSVIILDNHYNPTENASRNCPA